MRSSSTAKREGVSSTFDWIEAGVKTFEHYKPPFETRYGSFH